MRILVAEDERDFNRLICKTLERAGYSVDACFDGEEALDYTAGAEYDCILLDIMMPKQDGHAVLQALRAQGSATPIIFLTARTAFTTASKVWIWGRTITWSSPLTSTSCLRAFARPFANTAAKRPASSPLPI